MKKLFEYANEYLAQSDWKDLAMIKCCLCAIGVLMGLIVPKKNRKTVFAAALLIFAATYIPLMKKFVRVVKESIG